MNEKYTWDANGNMTMDANKGITRIKYNVLNLPQEILFSDGHIIRYKYAADGRKLRAEYVLSNIHVIWDDDIPVVPLDPAGGAPLSPRRGGGGEALPLETTLMTRDYCGNHIYRDSVLERITNDYGYWADGQWYYHIKDYQGNVRAVIDQLGTLKEINNYYPYGALMGGGTVGNNQSVQPYKYGTKELDRQNGLDWYDSQARMYDPLVPRFTTIDPMAEKYYSISPYAYCAGNPILYGDPLGMKWNNVNDSLQMNVMLDARLLVINTQIQVLRRGRQQSELSDTENSELKELETQKQSVQNSKQNLKELGNDNKNLYEFNYVDGDEIIAYNQLVNGVVKICTGHDFVLGVHEMDHIARYLKTGGLSFNDQGYLQPSKFYRSSISRYSSDEVLAYRAQFAFSKQGFPIFGIVKMTDISAEKVAAIVSADGIPVYQILYDYLTK